MDLKKMKEIHVVVDESQLSILLQIIKIDIGTSLSLLQNENSLDSVKKMASRLAFTIKLLGIISDTKIEV